MPENPTAVYEGDYFTGASQGFGYTDYDTDKQPMIPTFKTYLRRIDHYAGSGAGKRILDVGAATGFFLNLAREEGWQTSGIEPSDSAAQIARNKNLDVKTGILLPETFPSGYFDAITLWDVIEHLPDPKATLGIVHDLLKPGGVLAINTPDASSTWSWLMGKKWHLLCPPEHLSLFTKTAMERLLQASGFELLERDKIGKKFTLQYIAQTLAHWRKSQFWESAARRLHASAVGDWSIPINLRDNVFLVARKVSA